MSASQQAGFLAQQGLSLLYNATVKSVSAISTGLSQAYKTYTDYNEGVQIDALKKSGKRPADNLYSGTCLVSLTLEDFEFLCDSLIELFAGFCSSRKVPLPQHGRLQQRDRCCSSESGGETCR